MLSVYQHWDPLKICAVGKSYPPEFYKFIENHRVRSVMEKIAQETEEDYQKLIGVLDSFNVQVVRTDISDNPEDHFWSGAYSQPPMTPRDHMLMVGETCFLPDANGSDLSFISHEQLNFDMFYDEFEILKEGLNVNNREKIVKGISEKLEEMDPKLKKGFVDKLKVKFRSINHNPLKTFPHNANIDSFSSIRKLVSNRGNKMVSGTGINGATTIRLGKDLYFGTVIGFDDIKSHIKEVDSHLTESFRYNIVNVKTHADAVICPVKPGLVISLTDSANFEKTFPGWEVIELRGQGYEKFTPEFYRLKEKNGGKWWVPGQESNNDFTDFVETYLKDWILYVEESVFDLSMLIIDENNVICSVENPQLMKAFERHGITPHIVNFRHRFFWDGGIHCVTSDLHRDGTMKDLFS